MAFDSVFERYDRLVILDTEPTALNYSRDAVIRFAAKLAEQYGLQPERYSKFRRASALAEGENL